ncbi:MAG: hypothetical protein JW720_00525 [Sedimentisphaerales bacterium]|nr:hypothetical protein [Sedimentisphaerales bacterium]
MKPALEQLTIAVFAAVLANAVALAAAGTPLPQGARAVWDIEKAYRISTPTREKICINGLWQWQPATDAADVPPAERWGYFKVPGPWPGITDYMQKDSQSIYPHPDWKNIDLRNVTAAWYRREIAIPDQWAGRRITLTANYVNSRATVMLDGRKAGEIAFPGGELDITTLASPGRTHTLTICVEAMPLKAVILAFTDTNAARQIKGSVPRRGLCGDVYLLAAPKTQRIADVKVGTSVQKWQITFDTELHDLSQDTQYLLHAEVIDEGSPVADFTSKPFTVGDLDNGRFAFTENFKPDKLWDIHTPQNQYRLDLTLLDAGGKTLDAAGPLKFGFREFRIEGRDFMLNGTRIFLSSVPLDNAQIGPAMATYPAALESINRLKTIGINFVYTHNYDCRPGSHLAFDDILRAADDAGILVAFTQPHFSDYNWDDPNADHTNGYEKHADFYVRAAGNHPSVVFYAMSHNATGYSEDMNPDMIDGIADPRGKLGTWELTNPRKARRAEAIVKRLDPARIVYHHSSGNLGSMHTSNFYANFAPIQEISDWFEHWATAGVKPVFTCEYSVPFPWDWTMYRGWYDGKRSFGSAKVPWEFCLAEWNAQFLADTAFEISDMEKRNLRWEAAQFRAGNLWHRWDYPNVVGSSRFLERSPVYAAYFKDNWRAFRTWGVSAISPWSHGHYWNLHEGVDRTRKELPVDWDNLQRPGFSPDYIDGQYERIDLAFDFEDWLPTSAAEELMRNNRPLLAYIAGKPGAFTAKDHNFHPGELVEKQIIVINNSRTAATCDCRWSFAMPEPLAGNTQVTLPTGQQKRIPLKFNLPADLPPGKYQIDATFNFNDSETQTDSFAIDVIKPSPPPHINAKIALFDPNEQTAKLLDKMNLTYRLIDADTDLAAYDMLIVGKAALTLKNHAPNIATVEDGLKVIIFEQTSDVLEKRLGFRTAEYGLRSVFKRIPDHPILAGIDADHLANWRGDATILPPKLSYEMRPMYGPTIKWCDISVTRLWRCGNRGSVASALIEKPAKGDFLPTLDGGYSLQYTPLMEYRRGKGLVIFCQLDLTARTQDDPAADIIAGNILRYVSAWKPAPRRKALYFGEPDGRRHLEAAGMSLLPSENDGLSDNEVIIVGPTGSDELVSNVPNIADWLKAGGRLLAIGLDQQQANAFLPAKITMNRAEHIAAYFEPFGFNSLFAGVGPADVHCREPRDIPLVTEGADVIGNGVIAKAKNLNAVFCQLAPWKFDYEKSYNLKRTFRRTSCLVTRILANMAAAGDTPLLENFARPLSTSGADKRYLQSFYLDVPQEWDDPYRFFRW